MEIKIELDETTENGKKLLQALEELGVKYSTTALSAKNVALGIGRKATDKELEEYLNHCMNSELSDIDDLINEN